MDIESKEMGIQGSSDKIELPVTFNFVETQAPLINQKKSNYSFDYLLNEITIVNNSDEQETLLKHLNEVQRPTIVSFLNAHALNLCWEKEQIVKNFLASDILLRDGFGIELLMILKKQKPGINMNGTDFIQNILLHNKGKKIAIYGTEQKYLDIAIDNLRQKKISVIGSQDGFQAVDSYTYSAKKDLADIYILAMGMPKQEAVARILKNNLDHPCLIICGGAVIDFIAERFSRAPQIIRKMRLEWAYRIMKEPQRLISRYTIGGVKFIIRAFTN